MRWISGTLVGVLLLGCSGDATEQPYCGMFSNPVDGKCECYAGRSDCDNDRTKESGNGCECPGSCQGELCVGSTGSCEPTANNSCKSNIRFCDSETKKCKACPSDSYNCDYINDNACESKDPCGSESCDPKEKDACGETGYCSEAKMCTDCDPSWLNCDGDSSNKCEAQNACDEPVEGCNQFIWNSCKSETLYCTNNTSPPTCRECEEGTFNCDGENSTQCESPKPCGIGICDADCTTDSDVLCVKDADEKCQECLDDKHCGERELAGGPTCSVGNVCVCTTHEDCKARAAGIVCRAALGSLKRCGCDGDQHCSFPPYTKCSAENRCQKP